MGAHAGDELPVTQTLRCALVFYELTRPLLFALDPESAHAVALRKLDLAHKLGFARLLAPRLADDPVTVMGLTFSNPVGLAAGLDKNAAHVAALFDLGFGFVEAGTVTPRPQPGNPLPRLFRVPEARALINRLGFNNEGVDVFVQRLAASSAHKQPGRIVAINLGKNADTPLDRALDDYSIGLRRCYELLVRRAGYFTINISSPNTRDLRNLQQQAELTQLLKGIRHERARLSDQYGVRVPIAVKIAPDLDEPALRSAADVLVEHGIDAVIATNTTVDRAGVAGLPHAHEPGGLSGAPLRERSTAVVAQLHDHLRGALPIIGVGGILRGNDAVEKMRAGASLVQLYTGLIYRGTALIGECRRAIVRYREETASTFARAVSPTTG
jgi:dihydroorotate dehydrogenase